MENEEVCETNNNQETPVNETLRFWEYDKDSGWGIVLETDGALVSPRFTFFEDLISWCENQ